MKALCSTVFKNIEFLSDLAKETVSGSVDPLSVTMKETEMKFTQLNSSTRKEGIILIFHGSSETGEYFIISVLQFPQQMN